MLRVLLAEDHALVREGTRQILEAEGFTVAGEAGDGAEAVRLAAGLAPDVVVLDLHMPGMNGIEAARAITAAAPDARILVLSAYDDEDYVAAALDAGASGYLLKSAHGAELAAAIRSVAAGQVVMDAGIARAALRRRGGAGAGEPTQREAEVLALAARGLRTRDIASGLAMSQRTVEAHFTSIYQKFGVASRAEAVLHAAAHGWIPERSDRPLRGGGLSS
jgi:DNA-binding NarL/FixJ family response regulator